VRWLGTLLVWTSTALCAAVLILWPWSYHRGYSVALSFDRGALVNINNGVIVYWWASVGRPNDWEDYDSKADPMTADWIEGELSGRYSVRALGFAFGRFTSRSMGTKDTVAVVPLWAISVVLAVPMVIRIMRRRRRTGGRGFPVNP
jgi:hypothetical protein